MRRTEFFLESEGFLIRHTADCRKVGSPDFRPLVSTQVKTVCLSSEGAAFDSPAHRAGSVATHSSKPCKGEITGMSPLQGLEEHRTLYPARCAGLLNLATSWLVELSHNFV